jgi:excisionase family DNA binding protein
VSLLAANSKRSADRGASLPSTLSVQDAATLLGVSARAAYRAAERGEIPVFRLGRRVLVPTGRLLELLGLDAAWAAALLASAADPGRGM